MNMHSKVHIIFFLLNSGKTNHLLVIFHLLLKRKQCFVHRYLAMSLPVITGDLSCTANKTAFSTSEIGSTQNATQIFEGP